MIKLRSFNRKGPYQILPDGTTVKAKERKMERPGIFIGCSTESRSIADFVKQQFEPELYEVDIWDEGIFGSTDLNENGHQNIHWLKNFTDIYDFAIFIFVPDDIILSQTREREGAFLKEAGTRHNVVFEFGLFLGKIGSKKTFILFDDGAENFVNQFFTDLQDSSQETEENFIRFFKYPGRYGEWLETGEGLPYEPEALREKVHKIKAAVDVNASYIDISFLPSTSLAIGYFNNFINIVSCFFKDSSRDQLPPHIAQLSSQNQHLEATIKIIRKKRRLEIVLVIPDKLEQASHETCKIYFIPPTFTPLSFPGAFRPMTSNCISSCLHDDSDALVLCDLPTTLSSSAEAIKMLTIHSDIQELLNEKEKRNFKKVLQHLFSVNGTETGQVCTVSFIGWKQFLNDYIH